MLFFKYKVVSHCYVHRRTKGGRARNVRIVVVIGNRQGSVGVGVAKAYDFLDAFVKAKKNAKKFIIFFPITKKSKSIPHRIEASFGAAKVMIRPSPAGSGVNAGETIGAIFELSGVKNIVAKQLGSDNTLNNARAVLKGLRIFCFTYFYLSFNQKN
uniref:Ribosomal protein S5 n=1 Tax=Karlodinium veneficum TaxID=407301 RepID=G1E790_KARVE|nr:ribosomal protein S5 [Karlodinium veneficum]